MDAEEKISRQYKEDHVPVTPKYTANQIVSKLRDYLNGIITEEDLKPYTMQAVGYDAKLYEIKMSDMRAVREQVAKIRSRKG